MDTLPDIPETDEGLRHDLERLSFGRRRLLSLGAIGGFAALTSACSAPSPRPPLAFDGFGEPGGPPPGPPPGGFGGPGGPPPDGFGGPGGPGGPPPRVDNGPVVTGTGADGQQCIAFARETQGPYPADGSNGARGATSNVLGESRLIRSDIRTDFEGTQAARGVLLDLTLRLVDVNQSCAPLGGLAVYVWHCDAEGHYSLYDLPDRTFLRGLQISDAQGLVRFRTIVPGCYMGRYPHIHFEVFSSRQVATAGRYARLTSQLAIPAATCDQVYRRPDYARSQRTWASSGDITRDNVFGDNGAARIKAMTPGITGAPDTGLSAVATVGLVG